MFSTLFMNVVLCLFNNDFEEHRSIRQSVKKMSSVNDDIFYRELMHSTHSLEGLLTSGDTL
jgi:hypothetical protein